MDNNQKIKASSFHKVVKIISDVGVSFSQILECFSIVLALDWHVSRVDTFLLGGVTIIIPCHEILCGNGILHLGYTH